MPLFCCWKCYLKKKALFPYITWTDLWEYGPNKILQQPGASNFPMPNQSCRKLNWRRAVSVILPCFQIQQCLHGAELVLRRKHLDLEAALCLIKLPQVWCLWQPQCRVVWLSLDVWPDLFSCFVPFTRQSVFGFADKWTMSVPVILVEQQQGFPLLQAAVEIWH